ncbi:MAG: SHOCT domain-containing protein [Pseudomonadota bacterium]|nr:SHOCT domain-containing protein [Pseudomonadota bacterium]
MFHDGGFYMGGMHGLWWIFWVVLIGVLVFYAWGRPGEQRHRPRETLQEVLQRRLANGEITPDEYENRQALLDRDARAKT